MRTGADEARNDRIWPLFIFIYISFPLALLSNRSFLAPTDFLSTLSLFFVLFVNFR